ncbi:MAG: gliding motility-associated C-terminal domain-containing protein, partial [Flavobacteriales bacterium]|nr:gliding motility-associated C-terminal domain-containing protein [Flavobacteriales bacterium]
TVYDTCYEEGGTYEICLKIQNKNGCEHESCQTITVFNPLKVVPPNIFTPDGDGINDVFTFDFLSEGIQTFNCIIVNRWGVQMAEIDNVAAGWDGTDRNGSICRDGTYFYIYQGTSEAGDPFEGQGTVQIIGSGK